MKKEGTIGAAAFLAIAALVGATLHFGPKQGTVGQAERVPPLRRSPETSKNPTELELEPGCQKIKDRLSDFLGTEQIIPPANCYEQGDTLRRRMSSEIGASTSDLRFVIATLPDPIHTHQAVLFDQFAAAIQEAAQDERYDFDSSWLPWDDGAEAYALLADRERADSQKELREKEPGILLFRPAGGSGGSNAGLIVFVVAEDATHGIHKDQFRSALAWVDALASRKSVRRFAILGPTFSGSLSSLTELLSEQHTIDVSSTIPTPIDIYSGSVSSKGAVNTFKSINDSKVAFHSFVQNDDLIVDRFCDYMKWTQSDSEKFAILSEDETAYGHAGVSDRLKEKSRIKVGAPDNESAGSQCTDSALWLYYPKDISALRGAYQTKSMFDLGPGASPSDSQGRSLPSDLADPAGKVHDSIRSYGSNQTPLVQEAFLLEIVAALRDLHARYILLRGSSSLDQLFLANFLRRMYPSGRIVILSSDLLFIRERGATGLNGTLTLTNYPLFPLTRDWTEASGQPAADRVFSSDTSEGTYIAFRVLLNSNGLNGSTIDSQRCHVTDDVSGPPFVPAITCGKEPKGDYLPVPDYSTPYWLAPVNCSETTACNYEGPATWLTVIGVNRFWPIASLTASDNELKASHVVAKTCLSATGLHELLRSSMGLRTTGALDTSKEPGRRLETPPGMKLFFVVLIAFTVFHAWCCWRGSYTAKPNFLAHFASVGDWRHSVLVFFGSFFLAFAALVGAWGCGAFSLSAYSFAHPGFALAAAIIVSFIAWISITGRIATVWRLSVARRKRQHDLDAQSREQLSHLGDVTWFNLLLRNGSSEILRASVISLAALSFLGVHILFAEQALEQSDRAFTYWRAMNLSSGVSPIVPLIALLAGLYLWFWLTLHGLALFGPDRPRLPLRRDLRILGDNGQEEDAHAFSRIAEFRNSKQEANYHDFLRMFSQQGAARKIEKTGIPLRGKAVALLLSFFVLLLLTTWMFADGILLRGLGAQCNVAILMLWLFACISLQLVEACWLLKLWQQLRELLTFLDRLPLRRTLAMMRGISWGNVWRMGGNVLEVRYKVISRQLESMNHSLNSLEKLKRHSKDPVERQAADRCLQDLQAMRVAGTKFAAWYQHAYTNPATGDLTVFRKFQWSAAKATGTLLSHLLIPTWRKETQSLLLTPASEKESVAQTGEEYLRNAEEFVSLTYLGFIQNILGRIRTIAMTIMVLFLATTIALSTYPFDPRQVISAILIVLFAFLGVAVVKVYLEMHQDATLSNVTNTKPGASDPEFWFKILAFGFAPLLGLLAQIFPGMGDFIFTWIQPGISSLK